MKRTIILFCLAAIVFSTQCAASSNDIPAAVVSAFEKAGVPLLSKKIPIRDFDLTLLDGNSVRLSKLKGKIVFLNFWATWCPPCRVEMPSMETLYQRFKDKGFEMLAVNQGESKAQVSGFVNEHKYSFPVVLNPDNRVGNAYGIRYLPTTFVIGRDNEIILAFIGTKEWDSPEIIEAFEMLLNHK